MGAFFNDHAALRRYLVDEGFLDRDHGVYWRAGGRVDVDPDGAPVLGSGRRASEDPPTHRRDTWSASRSLFLVTADAPACCDQAKPSAWVRATCRSTPARTSPSRIIRSAGSPAPSRTFGPIPGGAERAICIAKRESGLTRTASSPDRDVPGPVPARGRSTGRSGTRRNGAQSLAAVGRRRVNGRSERDGHDPDGVPRWRVVEGGRLAPRDC